MAMHVGLLDAINKIAIYYLKPLLFIDMDDFTFSILKKCVLSKRKRRKLVVCVSAFVWHDVQKSNSPYFIDSQVLTMIIINREE